MSTPPPDARGSALDELVDRVGCKPVAGAQHDRACLGCAARAELSALRASQGAVAMEFVEAADRLRGAAQDPEHSCAPPWDRVIAYDRARHALRPAATGEGLNVEAIVDEVRIAWAKWNGDRGDTREYIDMLTDTLRAAIARAEGRKGTDG